jgi:glucosamine-6-phosphate deaminase
MKVVVTKDYEEMSRTAADYVIKVINEKPDLVACFPTGGTPLRMYEMLIEANAKGEVDFSKVTVLSVDGYVGLPPNHVNNFSYKLHKNLFNHCNFDPNNIFMMKSDAEDMDAECQRYTQLVDGLGGIDFLIDGIGENGHSAYNEPADYMKLGVHVDKISESTAQANSRFFNSVEEVPAYGITLGIDSFVSAKKILLLANGARKAPAIAKLTGENTVTPQFPVSFLKLAKDLTIIIDAEAAGGNV